jgi:hypothetical protein
MTNEEINEAVARKLGWTYHEDLEPVWWQAPARGCYLNEVYSYSTDIAAAWEIVERLRSEEYFVDILCTPFLSRCSVSRSQTGALSLEDAGTGQTPLAICLAYLKLKETK